MSSAETSRNIVLALLVVGIAIAVFYMIDPTFGGLLGAKEGFETAGKQGKYGKGAVDKIVARGPASVSGQRREAFEDGAMNAQQANSAPAVDQAKVAENAKLLQEAMQKISKESKPAAESAPAMPVAQPAAGPMKEGFADYASTEASPFPESPANCYPKNQLAPQELLPLDQNSKWAQVNPSGQGDISGKNFLSAGAMIGVNTVGQSLRNANQQLRSEPPNPQRQVSIWNQSTIEPDLQRKPLEGF